LAALLLGASLRESAPRGCSIEPKKDGYKVAMKSKTMKKDKDHLTSRKMALDMGDFDMDACLAVEEGFEKSKGKKKAIVEIQFVPDEVASSFEIGEDPEDPRAIKAKRARVRS
jgi:hypothetical protein